MCSALLCSPCSPVRRCKAKNRPLAHANTAKRQKCVVLFVSFTGVSYRCTKSVRTRRHAQSSSSPLSSSSSFRFCSLRLRSPFLGFSSFSHSLFAASLFRAGKMRLKTSEYHSTGWPSMPCLMFCHVVSMFRCFEQLGAGLPRGVPASRSGCPWGR